MGWEMDGMERTSNSEQGTPNAQGKGWGKYSVFRRECSVKEEMRHSGLNTEN